MMKRKTQSNFINSAEKQRDKKLTRKFTISKQSPPLEGMSPDVDDDIYHSRRKQTSYLVGFDDFEPEVCEMIKGDNYKIFLVEEKVKQLNKEIHDYKRYLELKTNDRDTTFHNEVKECLKEQHTLINEIQAELFKELQSGKKSGQDM